MIFEIIFIAVSIIVLNGIAIFIPKKITKIEIYATSIFALLFQVIVDIILDLKFDLCGYFTNGLDLSALIVFSVFILHQVL